ncbi:Uncharacterised protein g5697 [Pycnogonum litorale]
MDEKDEQIQVTMPPPDSVHKADEKSVKEETANAEAILDEKAASAVNIIQQIIQGGLTQTNQRLRCLKMARHSSFQVVLKVDRNSSFNMLPVLNVDESNNQNRSLPELLK